MEMRNERQGVLEKTENLDVSQKNKNILYKPGISMNFCTRKTWIEMYLLKKYQILHSTGNCIAI
jgi:hypothetical protein